MIHDGGGGPGIALEDLSRTLDLLDQQHRRILDLIVLVSAGQRSVQRSTAALSWRSPARFEFDSRLTDLSRVLARSVATLRAALTECDRARDLVRSRLASEGSNAEWETPFAGYPAAERGGTHA